ncbi:MAG: 2-dehydropantoate 2-reductase [Kiritimatiellae bacterium]|nr:2-dehydropantoate 2-reductase [Kiritimatiellia bacterium]
MKIAIVGPGAIGCLLSSLLSQTDNDVCLLDKDPDRAEFLSKKGIRTEGTDQPTIVKVYAHTADITDKMDYVCLCVKSYDTSSAIRHAMPLIGPSTIIVSFQNGLGNAEQIVSETGHHRVLCAVTSHGSTLIDTGYIRHAGTGTTAVASLNHDLLPTAYSFAKILSKAGINTSCENDLTGMLWSKVVINAAINPLTAVYNVPNGEITKRPDLKAIAMTAVNEAAQVATAKGIQLSYDDPEKEVVRVCSATANNTSSMLQDIRNSKRTEIDAITGGIIQTALSEHINVPTNKMLLNKVKSLEQ